MINVAKDQNGLPKRGKQFDAVQIGNLPRNKFNLSYNSRGSYNFGWLYPVDFELCCPGDTWSVKRSAIIKAAPMVAPIYQKVDVSFHTFAVPLRIIWHNFEKMRSPGNGTVSLAEALSYEAPTVPTWSFTNLYNILDLDDPDSEDNTLTLANLSTHSRFRLLDELNLPSPVKYTIGTNGSVTPQLLDGDNWTDLSNTTQKFSALPLRAYYKIWYDYFRDPNNYSISEPIDSDTVSTAEFSRICQMRPRAWEHDYFTSALLTPQRGPAVSMSLFSGGNLTINNPTLHGLDVGSYHRLLTVTTQGKLQATAGITGSTEGVVGGTQAIDAIHASVQGNPASSLSGSVSASGSVITIEQLRQYNKMQEWLELQARVGARYSEFLLGNFNVISSDARLQRPEYIAGGMMPLTISDVVNQSSQNTGSYSGMAEGQSGDLDKFQYYCEEDCYIITLMSIMPRTSYSQGIRKYWLQQDTFDFLLPKFAQLGEQPVLGMELYFDFGLNHSGNSSTFGYQSQYQWLRYNPDTIHGDFRTTYNHWTLSRLFGSRPTLGYNFISSTNVDSRNAQLYRFFQVTDPRIDHFYVDIWHDIYVDRELPEFNVPSL